ncbi:isoprenylcysteine carboxylmethyltransferase family protein [Rhodophyticola sp. CCM32]|uniref:methyltransferase family protein n=1 Tax=Rhodophyticola sp. CCM32 TaxID=2916397 RepID=UPI00107F0A85|nr:isoprenylcysteine carboxylmethyltransferase family protein [Rhodophyticola sp. CCM32]QBY00050.1 isoprenylcysteine carboxylmethyltransferase family protein [Rhodophyticola sp. CCM32]
MKGFPDLPPVWLAGFLALAWFLARQLPLVTVFGPVLRGAGVGLGLAGLVLIFWSALWFFRKKTTIEPHEAPQVLITEGPFRLSRNPIYLGMMLILTGYVLWLGVLSPVLLPILYLGVLSRRFVIPEEERLISAFGPAAHQYLKATRRWL